VRGNDAARQLVPRPESVFSQVRSSQTPAGAPLSLHDFDQITYTVTPPRQNSMESDRPTHIFTDTQSQCQCCTRISLLPPTLNSCFETASSGTLLATNDECLQTASRLDCDHTAFRLSLSRDRRFGSDLFWQSLFRAFC
jgi:hypothetical protein